MYVLREIGNGLHHTIIIIIIIITIIIIIIIMVVVIIVIIIIIIIIIIITMKSTQNHACIMDFFRLPSNCGAFLFFPLC